MNKVVILKNVFSHLILFLIVTILSLSCAVSQVVPTSQISDTPTSIVGFNHIGISVKNLDKTLSFYQKATGFDLIKREKINQSENAEALYDIEGISYERATLKGPNMLLELTQYSNQNNAIPVKMLPQGPGMTHTCFQSPDWDSGYDKFKNVGADMLSRGDEPIDLGGYGVTYAYAYDPEGNMFELEQIAKYRLTLDSTWLVSHSMWMTQVALISPDLESLVDFYRSVLDIPPYRKGEYANLPRMDDVIDSDSSKINITWFRMDGLGKMLELMEYKNPETPDITHKIHPTDLGYSFSL